MSSDVLKIEIEMRDQSLVFTRIESRQTFWEWNNNLIIVVLQHKTC